MADSNAGNSSGDVPACYERREDTVLMLTKKTRSWWRNFEDQPAVELRLAGRRLTGTADALPATDADLDQVVDFLTGRPVDAKAYGVVALPDGFPDPESVRASLPRNVLVTVELD